MDKTVFIAMPFDESFNEIYNEAIKPAFIESGLTPYKVNELNANTDIMQDIEDGIKNSVLVFADMTNKNPNVFYEVGFARAYGKNIIPATQKKEDVTFDLRHRRYILYSDTENGLKKFKADIKLWINEIIANPNKHNHVPKVLIHGTKFDVPNRNEFWNDLPKKAEGTFYLLGGSNKSWINKSEAQSHELAKSIVRIIRNNGTIKLISDDSISIIGNHREFYRKYIKPKLSSDDDLNNFKCNFKFGVVKHSNYQAVISDNRIVLLPTMNSKEFKDESLVMELEGSHLTQFKNYLADIERLFTESKCRTIDITLE